MGGYSSVQPGDCVVAFSRRDIYAIKQFIEQETKHRACVVYGALPPETRRQQAKLFNEQGERQGQCWIAGLCWAGLGWNWHGSPAGRIPVFAPPLSSHVCVLPFPCAVQTMRTACWWPATRWAWA